MAQILMIIAQKDFRDEELLIPKGIFEAAGYGVKIASLSRAKATGMMGTVVHPDFGVGETNSGFYDAVIVVGGAGTPSLWNHAELDSLLGDSESTGKLVCAICLGPTVLAKAGLLNGIKATVFRTPDSLRILRDNKAIYANDPVVVDGNIVTAEGPK